MVSGEKIDVFIGHHFYGAGNFGDDLMLAGFLEGLKPHLPKLRLSCAIPFNCESQKLRFPEIEWLEYNPANRAQAIKDCDVWLGLGDTPFQTDVGEWFLSHLAEELEQCKLHKKPMYYLCVGINNLEALKHPTSVSLLQYASGVWARDNFGANALRELVKSDTVYSSADLANIKLSQIGIRVPNNETISYVLNFENLTMFDPRVVSELVDRYPKRVHQWTVQEVRKLRGSETDLLDVIEPKYLNRLQWTLPNYSRMSVDDYLKYFGKPHTLISSRYHSILMGAWAGSQIIPIIRNDKVGGIVSELMLQGISGFVDSDTIINEMDTTAKIPSSLLDGLANKARSACSDFVGRLGLN